MNRPVWLLNPSGKRPAFCARRFFIEHGFGGDQRRPEQGECVQEHIIWTSRKITKMVEEIHDVTIEGVTIKISDHLKKKGKYNNGQ